MMNSERYLVAFNLIEQYLRAQSRSEKYTSFSDLVREVSAKNRVIRNFQDDLRQYSDLRNAIVHTKKENFVIAEPHISTVQSIEYILSQITKPKTVQSYFLSAVFTSTKTAPLTSVLSEMNSKDYSQAPIVEDNKIIALLNSESIFKWLGSKIEEDVISIEETTVQDILSFSNTIGNFKLIKKSTTLIEVRDIFMETIGNTTPLEALIITEHGKATEKPIGIITRSEDLAMVIREIQS